VCGQTGGIWFSDQFDFGATPGWFYLGIYALFALVFAMFTFWRSLSFRYMCVRAAVGIHNALLRHILVLPKSFFDTNPSGRIINRFSRDTDIMDLTLSMNLSQFTNTVAILLANLIVISIATKWFGIALPPLLLLYFCIQRYYIPAARELQRIESITRSPIYSRFGEALNGVPTIRAYRKEGYFTSLSDRLMEINAQGYVSLKLTASWLAMRLDIIGMLIIAGTGALCIEGQIDPSLAGLALLYALELTRYLKQCTNMASMSESNMTSVERILQYLDANPEAAADMPPEVLQTMPADWPTHGAIEVQELSIRYRPEQPLVLRGVSFSIGAGDKVGLVGRTGSGKSSMLLALFRMVEPEGGRVTIDGVDTRTLGVQHLRSKMSIIPQDPFMYKGTVRRNLDPLEQYQDAELWAVLESVGLHGPITALEKKLDHMVVDNGANFSLGQRQLFCMARAMLRKSRILMMDEATASVDLESDEAIQRTIRQTFADVTMITIAHRLNTIMDSDKVVVLEAGKVVEDGEPHQLLQSRTGSFSSFVDQTGRSSSRHLRRLASQASMRRAESKRTASARFGSVMQDSQSFTSREASQLDWSPAESRNGSSTQLPPIPRGPSRLAETPVPEEPERAASAATEVPASQNANANASEAGAGPQAAGTSVPQQEPSSAAAATTAAAKAEPSEVSPQDDSTYESTTLPMPPSNGAPSSRV